jgi:hypothetical protein
MIIIKKLLDFKKMFDESRIDKEAMALPPVEEYVQELREQFASEKRALELRRGQKKQAVTPYQQVCELYRQHPAMDFDDDQDLHMQFGYTFSSPDCIAMIRPVRQDWPAERLACILDVEPLASADCWFVWLLCGSLKEAVKHLPCMLPWVGFAQRGEPARFIELEKALAKIG